MLEGCDHLHTELGHQRLVACGRPPVLVWAVRQRTAGSIVTTHWGACSVGHAAQVLGWLGRLPGVRVPSLRQVLSQNRARPLRTRRASIAAVAQRLPRPRLETAA